MTKFNYDNRRPYGENRRLSDKARTPAARRFLVMRRADNKVVAQFRLHEEAMTERERLGKDQHKIVAS